MTNNLLLEDQLSKITAINYDGDEVLKQQRLGAVAVNELVARFMTAPKKIDDELLAIVLMRLKDLQVRDYAMGLTNNENIDQLFNLWHWLLGLAPIGHIAPVACIFAACAYESGESDLADKALDKEQKLAALSKEVEEATSLELPMLEKNLTIIATLASVSTLIGLLGTVIGMIKAFASLGNSGGSTDSSALANGISEALINTALGIGTSAICIIAYNVFTAKIDELTYSIDEIGLSVNQNYATHHN